MNSDATLDTPSAQDDGSPKLPALFEHKKRKDWGLAILAWDRKVKRAYQFEDGELRIVAQGFYGLMLEVDRPADQARAVVRRLVSKLDAREARRILRQQGSLPSMTFDDQLAVFRATFPKGFNDPGWREKMRGEGIKRTLKRHRDPAIALAKELLAKEQLDRLLMENAETEIVERAIKVLGNTDLVSAAQVKPLKGMRPEKNRNFALGLHNVLYEPLSDAEKMAAWFAVLTDALGSAASWQLATVLPALVHPSEHVTVRPSSFRDQARWLAPRVTCGNTPDGHTYAHLLAMVQTAKDRVTEAGFVAQDLVDVADFIHYTLSPATKKKWEEAKQSVDDGDDNGDGKKSGAEAA